MTEHPPELVELVVNLIDDHRPVFDEQGHISGTVPGRGAWECSMCGISGTYDEVVLHAARAILDALKAGRYAVVKLPESDGVDDDGQEWFGGGDIRVDHTGRGDDYPPIYIDGSPRTVDAARREAADLLAAANAAEDDQ